MRGTGLRSSLFVMPALAWGLMACSDDKTVMAEFGLKIVVDGKVILPEGVTNAELEIISKDLPISRIAVPPEGSVVWSHEYLLHEHELPGFTEIPVRLNLFLQDDKYTTEVLAVQNLGPIDPPTYTLEFGVWKLAETRTIGSPPVHPTETLETKVP